MFLDGCTTRVPNRPMREPIGLTDWGSSASDRFSRAEPISAILKNVEVSGQNWFRGPLNRVIGYSVHDTNCPSVLFIVVCLVSTSHQIQIGIFFYKMRSQSSLIECCYGQYVSSFLIVHLRDKIWSKGWVSILHWKCSSLLVVVSDEV